MLAPISFYLRCIHLSSLFPFSDLLIPSFPTDVFIIQTGFNPAAGHGSSAADPNDLLMVSSTFEHPVYLAR